MISGAVRREDMAKMSHQAAYCVLSDREVKQRPAGKERNGVSK